MHRPTSNEHARDHALGQADIVFAELSHAIRADRSLDQTLELITRRARDTIPGDTDVSISTSTATVVATGSRARILDQWQYDAGHGPSLDATASGHTITVAIDDPDSPYTSFRIGGTGVADLRSATSAALPMITYHDAGALTVYSFGAAVAIMAADDGLLYDAADMAQHVRAAAESAAVIERAKGIAMERHACNADAAEVFITIAARQANLPTATYAQALVERVLHR